MCSRSGLTTPLVAGRAERGDEARGEGAGAYAEWNTQSDP
jgi:hypothetical protein